MIQKGTIACFLALLVLALAAPPLSALPGLPPAEHLQSMLLLSSLAGEEDEEKDEEEKKEKEEGKKKAEDEEADEEEEEEEESSGEEEEAKAEKKKGGITKEEADEVNALLEVSILELDQKSPRFISKKKDTPAFVMGRPGGKSAKAAAKSKSGKTVQIDGSRWGFVDLAQRKKRRLAWFEKYIALHEKLQADESLSEKEREDARKKVNHARAGKSREMQAFDQILCQVEIVGNSKVSLGVSAKDRQPGMADKEIQEQFRIFLEKDSGFKVISDRPETWRGKKLPGHTFICERELAGEKPETIWRRWTYFTVPKPKGLPAIVIFDCQAPKSLIEEQLEKEFEAFIQMTRFN